MSIFSIFTNASKKQSIRSIIETCFTKQRELGLFDSDPRQSAQRIVDFISHNTSMDSVKHLNNYVLAASWLVVFVNEFKASRELLSPYGTAAGFLLALASQMADGGELGPHDQRVLEFSLRGLNQFYDNSPIRLTL